MYTKENPPMTPNPDATDDRIEAARRWLVEQRWYLFREVRKDDAWLTNAFADYADERTAELTEENERLKAKIAMEIDTTEAEELAEHCRANNINGHSINADGSCNMGCC